MNSLIFCKMKLLYHYSCFCLFFLLTPLFNYADGQQFAATPFKTFYGYQNSIQDVKFTSDGSYMALSITDGTVELYNNSFTKVWTNKLGISQIASALAFSPDLQYLAVGIYKRETDIGILRLKDKKIVQVLTEHFESVNALSFSTNGKYFASGGKDKSLKLWENIAINNDSSSWQLLQSIEEHKDWINCIQFCPQQIDKQQFLATASEDFSIKIWKLDNMTKKWDLFQSLPTNNLSVLCMTFSPDGKIISAGGQDSIVHIWEYEDNQYVAQTPLQCKTGITTSLIFSPDGQYLAQTSDNKTIAIWQRDKNAYSVSTTLKGHSMSINSCAFSPDGKYLVSTSDDKTAVVWQISGVKAAKEASYLDTYRTEIQNELKSKAALFAEKDEFETTAEYLERKKQAEIFRQSVYDKYRNKNEDDAKLKIKNSYQTATLTIQNVGMYDADKQMFPITINDITENVSIPRADARTFKENWKKVKVTAAKQLLEDGKTFETFNIKIIHPTTSAVYLFGKQRDALYIQPSKTTTQSANDKKN